MSAADRVARPRRAAACGLLALSLAVTACGGAATTSAPQASAAKPSTAPASPSSLSQKAKQEGTLVWDGQFSAAQAAPVIQAFEKAYPGISVKYTDIKPTQAFTQIQVEEYAHKVQVDVSGVTGTNTPALIGLHIAETSTDWSKLGVAADYMDLSPGLIQDFSIGDFVVYNTKLVSASEAPKSWSDLLNPHWKGKIAVDGRASFLDAFYNAPQLGAAKGLAFAKQLTAQQPSYQANLEQVLASVAAGQFALGSAVISQVLFAQKKGEPIGIASVGPINMDQHWLYIPKGAPHPAAAQLFVSWMASKGGQAALARSFNSQVPRTVKCPGSGGPVLAALCGHHVTWVSPRTLAQIKGEAKFTGEVRKVFGTHAGA